MHILVGIAASLALLYFWLLGHWFARVVAFLVFAVITGITGAALLGPAGAWPGAFLGIAAAWPISGLPLYYWRYRLTGSVSGQPHPPAAEPQRDPPPRTERLTGTSLSPAERARLAAILGMLGSASAGERDNAAAAAEQFRRQHGLTWAEMLGAAR